MSQTDIPVCVTGRLTVTFSGDAATGCALRGLCGYAGTETWQPQSAGELSISVYRQHGRRSVSATMFLGGPGNPVQEAVQRSRPTATSSCGDHAGNGIGFFALPVSGSRMTVGLDRAYIPLLGTRCAGPLDADLGAALPERTLPVGQILRGHTAIDLSTVAPFAAHGLSGTVSSTIGLAVGRPHRSSPSASSSPPAIRRTRLVSVMYRIERLVGGVVSSVRSSAVTAVCDPLDACGLHGVIDVMPGTPSGGSAFLTATAPVRRPERDLLTALGLTRRGDPSNISVVGGGAAFLRGAVIASLTQGGACHDHVTLREANIQLRKRTGRLQVELSPGLSQAADGLRTRCPGPQIGAHELASGWAPFGALAPRAFTVALHGGSFTDGPYRVTTRSDLRITLRLRRAKVTSQTFP
ncbi:MAG: hypothetical protein M3Y09_01105 [Actinomycetota bacterium]|nr:hypothetical protein [Actinomycetota bacterium]